LRGLRRALPRTAVLAAASLDLVALCLKQCFELASVLFELNLDGTIDGKRLVLDILMLLAQLPKLYS
jgi:hypothetical protein